MSNPTARGLAWQAVVDLAVHLVMALLGALGATALAWAYFWWRG